MDSASFEAERGNIKDAVNNYVRAREYCANSREVRIIYK